MWLLGWSLLCCLCAGRAAYASLDTPSISHWLAELTVYGRHRVHFPASSTAHSRNRRFFLLLILLAGDVAVNPGPSLNQEIDLTVPCVLCHRDFSKQTRPITCENCGKWVHSGCSTLTAWEKKQRRDGHHVPWFCGDQACIQPIYIPTSPINLTVSWSELPALSPEPATQKTKERSKSTGCDYKIRSSPNSPVFMSANVNSLRSKLDLVSASISAYDLSAFAVQESKLCKSIPSSELLIPGFELFRRDRSANGGGVAVFASGNLRPVRLPDHPALELVAVKLQFRQQPLILASCYRPPNQSTEQRENFLSNLSDWLAGLGPLVQFTVICGDLNIDPGDPWGAVLMQSMHLFTLEQIVDSPTHGHRLLDLCFVGSGLQALACSLGPTFERQLCGHASVSVQLADLTPSKANCQRFQSFQFSDADWNRAAFELLFNSDGSIRDLTNEVVHASSVDAAAAHLSRTLLNVMRNCVPNKTVCIRKFAAWMTKEIAALIRRKNAAFKRFRSMPSPSTRATFRRLHYSVRAKVKLAKQQFIVNSFEKASNLSQFWEVFRRLSGSNNTLPSLSRADGSFAVSDFDKAQLLASSFAENFNSHDSLAPAFAAASEIQPEWLCTPFYVQHSLDSLRWNCASGLDGLPVRFLRTLSSLISSPLSALINRCLVDCAWPTLWKAARVAPVPKVASSCIASDFRPVSILPILSKVGESWFLKLLKPYLQTSMWQFGFKRACGTEDAVATATHLIASGWNKCSGVAKVAVVSLDIKRAFDQVPHLSLLTALQIRGCPDHLLRLLRSYLEGRTQVVKVGTALSDQICCASGVPQGSLLGPYLFNAYADQIFSTRLSVGTSVLLYADDCLVIRPIQSPADEDILVKDLDAIAKSYEDLFLTVNPAKSNALLCSVCPAAAHFSRPISIGGQIISEVHSLKYLGVIFDRKLDFHDHVSTVAAKLRRSFGSLRRVFGKALDSASLVYLYKSKCLPVLTYALPVCSPRLKSGWAVLERAQRLAVRSISNDYLTPYYEQLDQLQLPSIAQLCFQRQCCLIFKYVHGQRHCPASEPLILVKIPKSKCFNLRQRHPEEHPIQLLLSLHQRRLTDQIPIYAAIRAWNSLSMTDSEHLTGLLNGSYSLFRQAIKNNSELFAAARNSNPVLFPVFDRL